MTFDIRFFLTLAFLTFVVAPITLVWTFIAGKHDKVSDRRATLTCIS